MRLRTNLKTLALTVGLAAISPNAGAQTAGATPGVPGTEVPATPSAASAKGGADAVDATETAQNTNTTNVIPIFSSPPDKLSKVVESLQQMVRAHGQPSMNIIFEPGVEGTSVPNLELFNVYGPDALMLIAAAAECVAKPIYGPESGTSEKQRIIGYRLQKENKQPGGGASMTMPGTAAMGPFLSMDGHLLGGGSAPGAPTTEPPMGRSVVGFGGPVMGGNPEPGIGLMPGGMPQPQVPLAPGGMGGEPAGELRVYALGLLNKSLPKERVVETISALLQDEDAVRSGVQVKFHDNTNVLVVRGPAETQRIVKELIEVLERNAMAGAYKSDTHSTPPAPTTPGTPSPALQPPTPAKR